MMTNLPPNFDYETTVAKVEAIIEAIDSGSLPLESVFTEFNLAVEQLQKCESFLAQGKEEMILLVETLED